MPVVTVAKIKSDGVRHERGPEGRSWRVLLRFKRLPRTFVSTKVHGTIRAHASRRVGRPPLFFPFDSFPRRETVVTTDRRESQGFSQTCLLSLTLLSRAAQDICTPPFASILSHERRKNKEKERRRKRDKEREREKTASQGHNPLYTGRRRQGLSAGSRVSSLAASRNSGRKTGPFLGETRTTDTHVSPRKTNFHSCPADLTTRNPENPTEHRLKPLLPRPHGGRDEISTRTGGRRVRRSIEGVNRIPVAARASQILRVGETSFDPFFTPSTSIFLFVLGKFLRIVERSNRSC